MKKALSLFAFAFLFALPASAADVEAPKGFSVLFNGKDLSGWHGWAIHEKGSGPYDLAKLMSDEQAKKIEAWTARHGVAIADWPAAPFDPFFNVNTPEDAAEAERIAAQQCDL